MSDISELDSMLQRNSEDLPSTDSTKVEADQIDEVDLLKRELSETKSKLKQVEGKFNKIKVTIKCSTTSFLNITGHSR